MPTAERPAQPHWTELDLSPHLHEARVGGRRLRFLEFGSGPPLLLVHGLGGCWQTWLENVVELAATFRVIAVDLPGFGDSEALPPGAEIDDYAEALVGLLDELELERAVVVGHSLGGLVSLRLAVSHPDRVWGLALVNAGGVPIGPLRLALILRTFLLFGKVLGRPATMLSAARRPRLRRAMLARFLADPAALSPRLAVELLPRMAAPGFASAARAGARAAAELALAEPEVPVLLLWGSADRILPLAAARHLAGRLPDARLEELEGVGHCPMLEAPVRFNELISAFAAELGRYENDRSHTLL